MSAQVVSFRCTLRNKLGQVISSTVNQDVMTQDMRSEQKLSFLAEGLRNLSKGEKRRICLRAEQAYGYYDPKLLIVRPLDEIEVSEPIILGESVTYIRNGKAKSFRVIEISNDSVTLDGNHPLAGQDLIFDIEAMEARDATPDEIDAHCSDSGLLIH